MFWALVVVLSPVKVNLLQHVAVVFARSTGYICHQADVTITGKKLEKNLEKPARFYRQNNAFENQSIPVVFYGTVVSPGLREFARVNLRQTPRHFCDLMQVQNLYKIRPVGTKKTENSLRLKRSVKLVSFEFKWKSKGVMDNGLGVLTQINPVLHELFF